MLQRAIQLHQAGQLAQAEGAYQRILAADPQQADALHLLGVLHFQTNRLESGIDLIRKALALQPNHPMINNNLGKALCDSGRFEEAAACCRRAIAAAPQYVDAMNNLGNALRGLKRFDEAIEIFLRAIQMQPNYPPLYNNLGIALRDAGRKAESVAYFQRAVELAPTLAEALHHLGGVLKELKRYGEAVGVLERSLQLRPNFVEGHALLGDVLFHLGKAGEARGRFERALALDPNSADAHLGLGAVLHLEGKVDEAIKLFERAIALRSDFAAAHYSMGAALHGVGRVADAVQSYKSAGENDTAYPEAHYNLGMAKLLQGDLETGWREYEWRWKVEGFTSRARNFPQPQWDGSPLKGKTILLHAEQGLGDSIHFIRYVPLVAQQGGRVIVEVPAPLVRLFRESMPQVEWIESGAALPAFDLHCPLLSLPLAFQTTLATIPNAAAYLNAPADDIAKGREALASVNRPKIGVSWAGGRHYKNDRMRSIWIETFAPLLEFGACQFVSLQKGEPPMRAELGVIDHTAALNDFAATAGLMASLDLVISVDTAVAHLAGALGKPVWILLPRHPDWRWMLERIDSPWYPTARLFRQRTAGDWPAVIAEVIETLRGHKF